MMAPAEMRLPEKTYNKMSFKAAKKLFNSFDFELYLQTTGSQSFDTIIVSQPAFLRQVNELMGELPIEDWTTYLTWKSMNHYAGSLDEEWMRADFEFYQKTLSGKNVMKPSHERVIEELTGSPLGELLGKAFVEKSYSANAQQRVNSMVDNLLESFKDRIKGLEWMSDHTKKEALTKLNAIGRKLGFPDEWRDFTKLKISKEDHLSNLDNCARYAHDEDMAKLYKPVNRKEWGMPAHMVNAYYHPLLNEIAFPAGIMQPPFFDEKAEDAVNYGRIGMVIGHEFTHGFDDMGSKFAADGSFTNWWSESDRKLFEERTRTLGETFSGFCPMDGHCVNPDLTMGENIADLGGLTMAYYAYKRTDEFKKGEMRNGFTPAQRFFIAYAQLWKINYTKEELKNRIANDPHSPGMYRVNGPLMNCPEFFEAFNVKPGDKMRNETQKVARIW
jgi:putative endopeptidase